eukprot:gene4062-7351_t
MSEGQENYKKLDVQVEVEGSPSTNTDRYHEKLETDDQQEYLKTEKKFLLSTCYMVLFLFLGTFVLLAIITNICSVIFGLLYSFQLVTDTEASDVRKIGIDYIIIGSIGTIIFIIGFVLGAALLVGVSVYYCIVKFLTRKSAQKASSFTKINRFIYSFRFCNIAFIGLISCSILSIAEVIIGIVFVVMNLNDFAAGSTSIIVVLVTIAVSLSICIFGAGGYYLYTWVIAKLKLLK